MKLSLKGLNKFGFSHILVPLVAIVIIGGIGSYVAVKSRSHADAAVPQLSCNISATVAAVTPGYLAGSTQPGSYYNRKVTVKEVTTNLGGGATTASKGEIAAYSGNGNDTGTLATGQDHVAYANVPALTHAQTYSWSHSFYYSKPSRASIANATIYGYISVHMCSNNPLIKPL